VSTLAVTTFLALLSLTAGTASVGLALLVLTARVAPAASRTLGAARVAVEPMGLWLAFAIALTATFGSLYLSEVARFVPCTLCWYQRIAMYPLVLLLGMAAVRRDASIVRYAVPLAVVGGVIAAYHVALQRMPGLPSGTCSLDIPCTAIYVERFGFVTIPVMALICFVSIAVTLTILVPRSLDS
jgi:disulfide bond formation protein DsbB